MSKAKKILEDLQPFCEDGYTAQRNEIDKLIAKVYPNDKREEYIQRLKKIDAKQGGAHRVGITALLSELRKQTNENLTESTIDPSKVFDEVAMKLLEPVKKKFLDSQNSPWNSSKETDDSLKKKAEIIKARMKDGRDFNEICDDKDIYLGSNDSSFVYSKYILNSWKGNLEDWHKNRIARDAMNALSMLKR